MSITIPGITENIKWSRKIAKESSPSSYRTGEELYLSHAKLIDESRNGESIRLRDEFVKDIDLDIHEDGSMDVYIGESRASINKNVYEVIGRLIHEAVRDFGGKTVTKFDVDDWMDHSNICSGLCDVLEIR